MMPKKAGKTRRIGRVRRSEAAEVLLDVALRAEKALFFAGPERNADRAPWLHIKRLQDAHGFHGHDAACSIVSCACAGDPAVEMAADHDNLIFQPGVRPGDLGDGVEAVLMIAGEFGFDDGEVFG